MMIFLPKVLIAVIKFRNCKRSTNNMVMLFINNKLWTTCSNSWPAINTSEMKTKYYVVHKIQKKRKTLKVRTTLMFSTCICTHCHVTQFSELYFSI